MKRLLNLACGIVHRPSLLLLDEPTVGVDLQSRELLLAQIRHYADAGAGVIYSTHSATGKVIWAIARMVLLFAVGWALFGISLGRNPLTLIIPTVGISFAAAALGLVVRLYFNRARLGDVIERDYQHGDGGNRRMLMAAGL
jgi:hypothetical protein